MDKNVRGILKISNYILLIKRIKDGELYFVFPGGHKKEGETDDETCKREFREETNLEILPVEHVKDIKESSSFITSYYVCRLGKTLNSDVLPKVKITGPEIEKDESQNYYEPLWVNITDLKGKTIYPDSIVKMIIKGDI